VLFKKNILVMLSALTFFHLSSLYSFSQQGIDIQWQRILSGSRRDIGNSLDKTSDGGFILGGTTTSVDGDFSSTGPIDQSDIVIMKFTSYGALQWKKRYGGSNSDDIGNIIATDDGGYVFVSSTSSSDGDVNDAVPYTINAWIVKLDYQGSIQWKKCISRLEGPYNPIPIVSRLTDGSIIVTTFSNTGQPVPANDSANAIVYWSRNMKVVKMNTANGTIIWEKYFGGNGSEFILETKSNSTNKTTILIQSNSTNGDFPIPRNDSAVQFSYYYYLMEIDSSGTPNWIRKLNLNRDGGLPVKCNFIYSQNGGMYVVQSKHLSGVTKNEYLELLRISSLGDTLWRKNIGIPYYSSGSVNHKFHITYDNNKKSIVISKFNYDLAYPRNISSQQITNIDTTGNLLWDKKFIFPYYYLPQTIYNDFVSVTDGFLLTGMLELDNYAYDLMITKIGSINLIKGFSNFDTNGNGIKDTSENGFDLGTVNTEKLGVSNATTPVKGLFEIQTDTGAFVTKFQPYKPYYVISPPSIVSNFSTYFNKDSINFFIRPMPGKRDISITILPVSPARPGFVAKYVVQYKNEGTDTISNGSIRFIKDKRTKFLNALPDPIQTIGDTLVWNYSNLKPFDVNKINLQLELLPPPALVISDILNQVASITPSNDLTPIDDSSFLNQLVTGSFDPNDKRENFGGKIPLKKISKGDYLYYVVRFQNTGTDTAFTVRITDTLDSKLNWESFEMIGSSHSYQVTIREKNKINWLFKEIKLPDSNKNSSGSQGYIAYKIKAKNSLSVGEIIQNKAFIYFDFNLPLITNIATTTVSTDVITNINDVNDYRLKLKVSPNPNDGRSFLSISGSLSGQFILHITDNNGKIISKQKITRHNTTADTIVPIDISNMSTGMYYLTIERKGSVWTQKIIFQ
jgi:uncharacterized repeat protein (TIGR01451 family)